MRFQKIEFMTGSHERCVNAVSGGKLPFLIGLSSRAVAVIETLRRALIEDREGRTMNASTATPIVAPGNGGSPAQDTEFDVQTLLAALEQAPPSMDPAIAAGFDRLLQVAESLPLTTEECGFAQNWITSARQLWERDEFGAAHYQVRVVCKKLGL